MRGWGGVISPSWHPGHPCVRHGSTPGHRQRRLHQLAVVHFADHARPHGLRRPHGESAAAEGL